VGNLFAVLVYAANIHDTNSGILPAREAFEKYLFIKSFCANAGYRKKFDRELGLEIGISARIKLVYIHSL